MEQDKPPVPPGERYEDLIEAFTVLSRTLAEDESVHDTLQSILTLALKLVPGCSAASVTVLSEDGQPATIAATDDDTRELDRRQYVLDYGPCLDAVRRQQVNRWSLTEAEQHWPQFTSLAKELGLHSYLTAGLGFGEQRVGALNLSSRDTDGFSQLDEGVISLFIAPAAAAIMTTIRYARAHDLADQLTQALRSRAVIDQALGILMVESKIDAQRAFAVLSRASNNRRMKLRDLAAEIVTRVSGQTPAEYAGEPQP